MTHAVGPRSITPAVPMKRWLWSVKRKRSSHQSPGGGMSSRHYPLERVSEAPAE